MNYAFHDLSVASALPLPELRRTKARATLTIRTAAAIEAGGARWFRQLPFAPASGRRRRTPWLSMAHLPDGRGFLLRFPDLADFEVDPHGRAITAAASATIPASTLRHLLLDQVLPLVLHLRGRLALHASAVHVPGFGAIAFAGRAGSGKSTLAAALALRRCPLVTDDCLVFAAGDGAPMVVPGYPGVRLWPDSARSLRLTGTLAGEVAHYTSKRRAGVENTPFRTAPSRLRALFVLTGRWAARGSQARRMSGRERLMALVPYAWLIDVQDPARLAQVFTRLSALATAVPVCRLSPREGRRMLGRTADEVLALGRAAAGGAADSW